MRYLILFILTSVIAVLGYAFFARKSKGKPAQALPVEPDVTLLDRLIEPQWQAHPGQTGLVLLQDNIDAFMVRAISAQEAGRSLDLQYYIWHDDLTGRLLTAELLQAADRGVRVRLLLDDMNTHDRDSVLAALNGHPNIEVRLFNPTKVRGAGIRRILEWLLRGLGLNRRMHNKAWIADGRVAVVGGRNIGDEYFDASTNMNFFDVDLFISGPAVADTTCIFDEYWNSDAVLPLQALVKVGPQALLNLRQQIAENKQTYQAQPYLQQLHDNQSVADLIAGKRPIYWSDKVHVYADPASKAFGREKDKWLLQVLQPLWQQVKRDFCLISPYFVPTKNGLKLFQQMRHQAVEVNILTNSLAATDVFLVHSGYAPYRKPLLAMGAQLYELKRMPSAAHEYRLLGSRGASLHTKAFLVDQTIAFVGSFNFDPRSMLLNTEMGIIFNEPAIVCELKSVFSQRISAPYSYQVQLNNGALRWCDIQADGQIHDWQHDPQTKWWHRLVTKLLSWLPIESQL